MTHKHLSGSRFLAVVVWLLDGLYIWRTPQPTAWLIGLLAVVGCAMMWPKETADLLAKGSKAWRERRASGYFKKPEDGNGA